MVQPRTTQDINNMKSYQQSIGKERAIALANSNWWEGKDARTIAKFQLFTAELSCPFGVFHEALEKALGRPVWTHELGMNFDGIVQEFLGERDAPTMKDIIELIPEEKRIVCVVGEQDDADWWKAQG